MRLSGIFVGIAVLVAVVWAGYQFDFLSKIGFGVSQWTGSSSSIPVGEKAPPAPNGGGHPAAKNGGHPAAKNGGHGGGAAANGGGRVLLSVYDFFRSPGSEPTDYALYSYALIPGPGPRADQFFASLVARTGARSSTTLENAVLNVILLPVKPDFNPAGSQSLDPANFGRLGYAYETARDMLARLCAGDRGKLEKFCAGDPTGGPYVVSFKAPASALLANGQPLPRPFLFVDFTNLHVAAFSTLIEKYKEQVRRDEFDDSDPANSLRLHLLSITLTAADLINPIRTAIAEIMETVE